MRRKNRKSAVPFLALGILVAVLTAAHAREQTPLAVGEGRPVGALFGLATPASGPFPSDRFTAADPSHNTGLRVNLPMPDCRARPSDCEDLHVINTLDGFNLLPRLSIPFDGPIDLATATGGSIILLNLGDTLPGGDAGGRIIGINRTVWDPITNTLHAESDELLDQHTRYALIVTRGVRDPAGAPVKASHAFWRFVAGFHPDRDILEYQRSLLSALWRAGRAGVRLSEIVSASVFTTQSTTAVLEKIRDQIKSAAPAPVDFNLGSGGTRTVFPLGEVTDITFRPQTGGNPPGFGNPVPLNLSLLRINHGAIGQVAFGKYTSPEYIVHPGEYIPEVGTRTGTPQVQRTSEIYFNLFLPSGTPPPGGRPVAIFGIGSANNKNNQPLEVAAAMAARGIATISINLAGNGFGPLGTLTVNRAGAAPVTLPAGGRSIDQNQDGLIVEGEGRSAGPPWTIISSRDAARQTIADFMQLVRVIGAGIDADGDGSRDLDPSRIYYFGHSLGGMWGTIFLAVEPSVRAGVLNSVGTPYDNLRLSPAFRAGSIGVLLASRAPSLINPPGLTEIGGVAVGPPHFDENLPLRNQPPVVNTVAGAIEIQELLDRMKWVTQSASSLAYAPYLRKKPLPGVAAKSVLFQFSIGDQHATNPTTTAVLRAGDLADRTTYFRNDLAFAENPAVPKNPHLLIRNVTVPAVAAMARGIQEQIAVFFASDGAVVIHPEPARFFEVPINSPLPEGLNFIP